MAERRWGKDGLRNIVLIGARGAGKSAAGKRLAEHLGAAFLDTDGLIEESAGMTIQEIVESLGWEHFRRVEKETIREASRANRSVIAPGGGAVLDPENMRALKDKGLVIWLKAPPRVLAERLEGDGKTAGRRPSLTGKGTASEIEEVLSARSPLYRMAAEEEIDTSGLDVEGVVGRILSLLEEKKGEGSWEETRSGPCSG